MLTDPLAVTILIGGFAAMRVRLAGVCSTDLQILAGYMGFTGVLGHEWCE